MTEQQGYQALVEGADARSRIVLVCEHASNAVPQEWAGLGLTAEQALAHIAWDPGALGLARGLAKRLGAVLVHAPVSRLVYDCNRAPDSLGAMPPRSEVHDIPGNAAITPEERARRTAQVYVPFHAGLGRVISDRIALGFRPVIVTVHSFTPIYHGKPREVEFGVIHDDTRVGDEAFARQVVGAAWAMTGVRAELNAPYSAKDEVTHLLRRQAVPFGLPHAMLEVRNDLIATPDAEEAMADQLAPVLARALAALEGEG